MKILSGTFISSKKYFLPARFTVLGIVFSVKLFTLSDFNLSSEQFDKDNSIMINIAAFNKTLFDFLVNFTTVLNLQFAKKLHDKPKDSN